MRSCDILFAQIVRARGRCEAAMSRANPCKGNLQCAHGFPRSYHKVRTDTRNAFCLCAGCHTYYTDRPLEWDDWLHAQWGDVLYAELRELALYGPRVDWKAERVRLSELWASIS
jgi:hypothetical protein